MINIANNEVLYNYSGHSSQATDQKSHYHINSEDQRTDATPTQDLFMGAALLQSEIKDYSEVFVWGSDKYGQLGIDSQYDPQQPRPPVHLVPRLCSFNVVINAVACGLSHSALLTDQGHLYTMGSNGKGQLGVAMDLQKVGFPTLVETLRHLKLESVACGSDFTFAIARAQSDLNAVFSWGNNSCGQLALPASILTAAYPTKVAALDVLEEDFLQVSCGLEHTLFLTSSLDVIGCGNNEHGQCGFDPAECPQTNQPYKAAMLERIVSLAAGYKHSLFLAETGEVFTTEPKLRIVTTDATIVRAAQTSACINKHGELFVWGTGDVEKVITIPTAVKDVSLGAALTVALDVDSGLWVWGSNKFGELGFGDKDPRTHPCPVLALGGKNVSLVQCGGQFTICLGQNVTKAAKPKKAKRQQSTASTKSKVRLSTVAAKVKPFTKLVRSVSPIASGDKVDHKKANQVWKEEYSKQCAVIAQLRQKIDKLQQAEGTSNLDQKLEIQKLQFKAAKLKQELKARNERSTLMQNDFQVQIKAHQQRQEELLIVQGQARQLQQFNTELGLQLQHTKQVVMDVDKQLMLSEQHNLQIEQQLSLVTLELAETKTQLQQERETRTKDREKYVAIEAELARLRLDAERHKEQQQVQVFVAALTPSRKELLPETGKELLSDTKSSIQESAYDSCRPVAETKPKSQVKPQLESVVPWRSASYAKLEKITKPEPVHIQAAIPIQAPPVIQRVQPVSVRDKYSEHLIKTFEMKALAQMRQK